MMPTVDALMSRAPYAVSSSDDLERAMVLMARHAIRHLPVVDGTQLVGVLLEREIVVLASLPGLRGARIPVWRAMRPALGISRDTPLDEAVALMAERDLDCLVVRTEEGVVEGIVTAVDARKALAAAERAARPYGPLPLALARV